MLRVFPDGSGTIGDKNGTMANAPVLSRPRNGAVVAGVCAGLGRRWRVDPALLRIAVCVLAFAGGLGLIGYGAAILLIPAEGSSVMPIRNLLPFTRSWPTPALIAAVGFACSLVVAALGGWSGLGLGPLFVIGGFWYVANRPSRRPRPTLSEPTPFERAAEAWRVRLLEHQALVGSPIGPSTIQIPPQPVAVRARPRALGPWTAALGLLGLGMSLVAGLGALGVHASPTAYWAAALIAFGVTLVAFARRGRAPLMLPVTVAIGLVTLAMMLPAGPALGAVGAVSRAYAGAAALPSEVTVGMGEVSLDLSALALTSDATTAVRVGAGTAIVRLPRTGNADVTWRVKAGEFTSAAEHRSGLDLSGRELVTHDPGAPTVRVDVVVQAGTLEVIR